MTTPRPTGGHLKPEGNAGGQTATAEVVAALPSSGTSNPSASNSPESNSPAARSASCGTAAERQRAAAVADMGASLTAGERTALRPRLVLIICTWSRPEALAR